MEKTLTLYTWLDSFWLLIHCEHEASESNAVEDAPQRGAWYLLHRYRKIYVTCCPSPCMRSGGDNAVYSSPVPSVPPPHSEDEAYRKDLKYQQPDGTSKGMKANPHV